MTRPRGFAALLLVIVLSSLSVSACTLGPNADYETLQLSRGGSLYTWWPQVSGDRVVWWGLDAGGLGADSEIFTWTPTDGVVQLTGPSPGGRTIKITGRAVWGDPPAVAEDCVVWVGASRGAREVCYLEVREGIRALCAAEALAALRGDGSASLPDELKRWVMKHPLPVSDELLGRAVGIIDRVLGDQSEIRDLWSENEELFGRWQAGVEQIRRRLRE